MDLLSIADVADLVGIKPSVARNYHQTANRRRRDNTSRPGDMPPPDLTLGRTPAWHRDTITTWIANRPGQGAGGGRPRKQN